MKKGNLKPRWSRLPIILVVVAILAGLAGWYFYYRHSRIGDIRNVVLISIDTCRTDRLSCYGYNRPTTPNLDAVAREGVLFKNALTPVPFTLPAHTSMLTGMYPPAHGVHLNDGAHISDTNVTLAEILRDAGYQTAAFVGGFALDSRFGLNQGFGSYDSHFTQDRKGNKTDERSAEEVNRPAMNWLEKQGAQPFFLFLHYFDAHFPYAPPPPFDKSYRDDPYAGELAYVDLCIGRILERLHALGLHDNTLIVITSDHAESLNEHGEPTHGYFMYQSTLHVPLIIRAPGGGQRGRQVDSNVSLVDIVPTVLDLAGLKIPAQVQGMSLRNFLESRAAPMVKRQIYGESVYPSTFGCAPLHGLIEGRWKYIRAPRPELYNLKEDPGELNNLVKKEPPVAQRLRGRLETMLQQMETIAPHIGRSTVDPEAMKRLQSLGYVGGGMSPTSSAFDATREDPKDFLPTYFRFEEAVALFGMGRKAEAAARCLDVVKSRPEVVGPYRLLCWMALNDHRPADAKQYITKIMSLLAEQKQTSNKLPAAELNFEIVTCYMGLGNVLLAEGKKAEAATEFENALRIEPNLLEGHNNLGVSLLEQGKVDEAIARFRQGLKINPNYVDFHSNLGLALKAKGDVPEAITHFKQALEISPEYAKAHNNLGVTLQGQGQIEEAIAHFRKALESEPDYADACYNLASALQQTGKPAEAIQHFEQVLRLKSDKAEARYKFALALEQTGKPREAIVQYTEAIRLNADFAFALNNLAWIRATNKESQLRDGAEAVRLAERVCHLTGRKQVDPLDTLAAAFAEAGRFDDAVKTAEEAVTLARLSQKEKIALEIEARLQLYRQGRPYRQGTTPD